MKAIIINGPGDISYTEVKKPEAGQGDVLVRVRYSGICGTDLAILGGDMSLIREGLIKYPVRIGHEWSGIVHEIGPGVTRFKPGDRVVGDNGVTCGKCSSCLSGKSEFCRNPRSVGTVNCWDGSFAEYILMPERHLYKLPDSIDLEEAALIEPTTIALSGIKQCRLHSGSSVLVIGTGPIGLASVAVAKNAGAGKVFLAGRKDGKLGVGMRMGADAAVNVTRENLGDFIMRETEGRGVDNVVETSGDISCVVKAMDYIGYRGIIALLGFYEKTLDNFNIDRLVLQKIQLRGISGEMVVQEVIDLLSSGSICLKPAITHRFKFAEAVEAFRTAGERNETKIKMLVEITE